MDKKHLDKKLKRYEKYLFKFIKNNRSGVEDIHTLRIKSREIHSFLSKSDDFYKKIKKVIKLSNQVRDIDVFFEHYLSLLPNKYRNALDLKSIIDSCNGHRDKKIKKLYKYLHSFEIPKNIEVGYEKESEFIESEKLSLNSEELHQYRIYIKKLLFREKNAIAPQKKKIKSLTKIKDILGEINDNTNGLNRLHSYEISSGLFQKIQNYTTKINMKLFDKFLFIRDKGLQYE